MLLEVACDESGSEGERLVGGVTDVFAHAGVPLDLPTADGIVREIRDRIRSPAEEYKANHLLRDKHRAVLLWLLGEGGPVHGLAHVHLTDKTLLLVTHMVGAAHAPTVNRVAPRVFGAARWAAFLESFNNLMRVRNRRGDGTSVESFFQNVEYLRRFDVPAELAAALRLLEHRRPRIEDYRARVREDPRTVPALDPMVPAILRTVEHWSTHSPVAVVHDEQLSLTESRIARLAELSGGRLASLRLVDSRSDARVQVADFLAGVARRIASDALNGRGDQVLVDMLAPYVDPASLWPAGLHPVPGYGLTVEP